MILLQAPAFQIDLSSAGVSIKQENALFSDDIYQNYSLPFVIKADTDLLEKLGLPTMENVVTAPVSIECRLLLADRHYPAKLFIGEVQNNTLDCHITFGDQILPVYDVDLKNLPWPNILTEDFKTHAEGIKMQNWPTTSHNFPMVYKPDIADGSGFERFEGFVNNFDPGAGYIENEEVQEENEEGEMETVYVNRNVMVPFPYLLEILRFGFRQEGKQIIGDLVQHEDFRKAIYIPENIIEHYENSEYQNIVFSTGITQMIDSHLRSVYSTVFTPVSVGSYKLKIDLNIPPGLATYFLLTISKQNPLDGDLTTVQSYQSSYTRVQIDEELTINVEDADQFEPIHVEMILAQTDVNISGYNSFEYSFGGGQLLVFPHVYSLKNFMPDLTFGEYVNLLKNWLNLDIDIRENYVRLDFVQNTILGKEKQDHAHLEVPSKKRNSNRNRFYKLSYANGETVRMSKNGRIYSDLGKGFEKIEIEMDVQPAVVESNRNIITAVAPEDASDLDFCFYEATVWPIMFPVCGRNYFSLDEVVRNFWETWINFRINSFTFKDEYSCSVHEEIVIEKLMHKYNELHVIKKLDKKFESESIVKVRVESETF